MVNNPADLLSVLGELKDAGPTVKDFQWAVDSPTLLNPDFFVGKNRNHLKDWAGYVDESPGFDRIIVFNIDLADPLMNGLITQVYMPLHIFGVDTDAIFSGDVEEFEISQADHKYMQLTKVFRTKEQHICINSIAFEILHYANPDEHESKIANFMIRGPFQADGVHPSFTEIFIGMDWPAEMPLIFTFMVREKV